MHSFEPHLLLASITSHQLLSYTRQESTDHFPDVKKMVVTCSSVHKTESNWGAPES